MFQNMQEYTVTADTDIDNYVCDCTILVDGTKIYRFSKELLGPDLQNAQVRIHPERESHGNGRALNLAAVCASTSSEAGICCWIRRQCAHPPRARITREWTCAESGGSVLCDVNGGTYREDRSTFAGLDASGSGALWFLPYLQANMPSTVSRGVHDSLILLLESKHNQAQRTNEWLCDSVRISPMIIHQNQND
jgi:hypothetical protein